MQKRLPIPGQDKGNWGPILNAHISQLQDPDYGGINSFETVADRPTNLVADDQGKTYINNQTGNLHQWNGTAWEVLNRTEINVQDYGAVGDGVANDTVAIQAAIDLNKAVFFPSGTYLTDQLNLLSGNKYYTTDATLLLNEQDLGTGISNIVFNINNQDNIIISGFKITFSRWDETIASGLSAGIFILSSTNLIIEDMAFVECANWGITCAGTTVKKSENVIVRSCTFDKWGTRNRGAATAAIDFSAGSVNCKAIGNTITASTTFGISFWDPYNSNPCIKCTALNNIIENQLSYGILLYNTIAGANNSHIVVGNSIKNINGGYSTTSAKNFGAGIYAVGLTNLTIQNNTISEANLETNAASLAPGAIGVANCKGRIIIDGNACYDTGYFGLYVVGCTDGGIVSNNYIKNAQNTALYITNSNHMNVVSNNVTQTNVNKSCLDIRNTTYGTVTGNILNFRGTQNQSAILVLNSSDLAISANHIFSLNANYSNVRLHSSQRLVYSDNVHNSGNNSAPVLWCNNFADCRILGNSFQSSASIKALFSGTSTSSYVDKSNRLGANYTDNSTALTIDV